MNTIECRQERSGKHTALLLGCRLLATRTGEEELVAGLAALPDQVSTSSVRELLAEITEIASRCGLRPRISRPAPQQLFDPAVRLPLLAELHDQRTLLVEALHRDLSGAVTALTVQIPTPGENMLPERMARDKFLLLWNGTTIRFERINTALTCSALFALITPVFFKVDIENFAILTNLLRSHYPCPYRITG